MLQNKEKFIIFLIKLIETLFILNLILILVTVLFEFAFTHNYLTPLIKFGSFLTIGLLLQVQVQLRFWTGYHSNLVTRPARYAPSYLRRIKGSLWFDERIRKITFISLTEFLVSIFLIYISLMIITY